MKIQILPCQHRSSKCNKNDSIDFMSVLVLLHYMCACWNIFGSHLLEIGIDVILLLLLIVVVVVVVMTRLAVYWW